MLKRALSTEETEKILALDMLRQELGDPEIEMSTKQLGIWAWRPIEKCIDKITPASLHNRHCQRRSSLEPDSEKMNKTRCGVYVHSQVGSTDLS